MPVHRSRKSQPAVSVTECATGAAAETGAVPCHRVLAPIVLASGGMGWVRGSREFIPLEELWRHA